MYCCLQGSELHSSRTLWPCVVTYSLNHSLGRFAGFMNTRLFHKPGACSVKPQQGSPFNQLKFVSSRRFAFVGLLLVHLLLLHTNFEVASTSAVTASLPETLTHSSVKLAADTVIPHLLHTV
jgi:hypothetical protein